VRDDFVRAARMADAAGFDIIELHCAHGYLLASFLSPLTNRRQDEYGGSLENRMRFALRVAEAVRAAWPKEKPLGARITGTDWVEGGFTIDEAVVLSKALKERGVDFVCVSSGGIVGKLKVPFAPGYLLPHAARVKREAGVVTEAVGFILTPQQAEAAIGEGQCDMVALARAILDDPRWGWHAAAALGAEAAYPVQYERVKPAAWPGAKWAKEKIAV
jgi:2,4-dienoyl-CoA reductase-like NADH-dependent reductase (Old Yellow Enzyme family)